ncbi:MAG: ferrous iron transporter B, partial [Planctomycetes bacterium]|nr:ferrous iron transporter B [Planctomycetota bacterium]
RGTLFRGETIPFVMELPPYRVPTVRGVLIHMWQRGWMYLRKAGTILLAVSIILWAAASYPKADESMLTGLSEDDAQRVQIQHSVIGRIGKSIEPVVRPLGFDWRIGTALVGSFAAKEVFVSQMGIMYSMSEAESSSAALRERLSADYNALQGFCIMLFCLISMPCVATVAMTRQETGSWGWAFAQLAGLTVIAWLVTFAVYQIGNLILYA